MSAREPSQHGGILRVLGALERLAGHEDPRFRRGLLCAFGEAAAGAAAYGIVFHFIREAFAGRAGELSIWRYGAALAVALLLQLVLARPAFVNVFCSAFALMADARLRVLDHLRRLPMSFFGKRTSGDVTTVLTTEMSMLEDLLAHAFALFTSALLLPILLGAALWLLDWRMGLTLLSTLPVAILVLAGATRLLQRGRQAVISAMVEVSDNIVEYSRGISVLRLFGQGNEGLSRMGRAVRALRGAQVRSELWLAPLIGAYGASVQSLLVVSLFIGLHLLLNGTLDAQTLLAFLILSVAVSRRLYDFGVIVLQLRAAASSVERVEAILATQPLPQAQPTPAVQGFALELDRVSFDYGGERVLHEVSACIPERSLTAIVGPSGAGKSTLLHLIARLWELDLRQGGAIRLGGADIRDLPFEELHARLSMVFQDVVLFAASVGENIRLGRAGASEAEVVAAARAAGADEFILALPRGYDTFVGEGGSHLSGGEKQRISIARAVLKNAPIVLLDEATASLDTVAEQGIQAALRNLVENKTVVCVAHHLATVIHAHQILVLEEGRLIARGTHSELLERCALYRRLWELEQRSSSAHLAVLPATGLAPAHALD